MHRGLQLFPSRDHFPSGPQLAFHAPAQPLGRDHSIPEVLQGASSLVKVVAVDAEGHGEQRGANDERRNGVGGQNPAAHPLEERSPSEEPETGGSGRVQRSTRKTTGHRRATRGLAGTRVGSLANPAAKRKLGTGGRIERAVLGPASSGTQSQSEELTKSTWKRLGDQSPGLSVGLRIPPESVVPGRGAKQPSTSQRAVGGDPGPLSPGAAASAKVEAEGMRRVSGGERLPAGQPPKERQIRILKPKAGTGAGSRGLHFQQPGPEEIVAGDLGEQAGARCLSPSGREAERMGGAAARLKEEHGGEAPTTRKTPRSTRAKRDR